MIETPRLILRGWREADVAPFHAMGQDEEVMRYLGPLTTLDQARAAYKRCVARQAEAGCCFWAIERKSDAAFLGFCGLQQGYDFLEGEIEIGWRLRRDTWGQGYAREAAQGVLAFAFGQLGMDRIYAQTSEANRGSWALMEKLGMTRRADLDYPDPDYPPEDNPTMVYQLARADWVER